LGRLREAEENNWSASELRKQVRLAQADESATLTIESLNLASLYQHINSLYSFVKSCDVAKDAAILDKLEEDARSLIRVISEKHSTCSHARLSHHCASNASGGSLNTFGEALGSF